MEADKGQLHYNILLVSLVFCALLLTVKLAYSFFADTQRFPVNTVKVAASYQHVTRKQLESVLANYLNTSFFLLPVRRLQTDLASFDWAERVQVERVWPDTLKITLVEKSPVAIWNDSLMSDDGTLLKTNEKQIDFSLPKLSGPVNQRKDVLQIYQKLSKLLTRYGLQADSLRLHENQAWEISLTNGIQLRLGKQNLEERLQRFCKAYSVMFADKAGQVSSVDLRYAHGLAVQWKH